MKKMFIIHNIDKEENKNSPKMLPLHFICKKAKSFSELELPQCLSESLNLSPSSKTDLIIDNNRKSSINSLSTENTFSFNINNNSDYFDSKIKGNKEEQTFLCKKTKFNFNVHKNISHNKNFFTIKNYQAKLNQKEKAENEVLDLEESNTKIKSHKKIIKNEAKDLNEGRWTIEEKTKFIEAFLENGKKWKIIQNYIGTRTSTQTRSHAQKFLLKLKSIENNEFNFKKETIKDLSDIIEEIKNIKRIKNNDYKNDKKYIIDTLLKLSERNSYENKEKDNNNNDIKDLNNKYKFENLNSNIELDIFNKDNEVKNGNNLNNINDEINNNENKKDIGIKGDNNNNEIKLNDVGDEGRASNEYFNYNCFCEPSNQKLIFDDGYVFYNNSDNIFYVNNNSYYIREYDFIRNTEQSKYINRFFFC